MKPTFYIAPPLASATIHDLFYFKFSPERLTNNVFGEPPFRNYFAEDAIYADNLDAADAILLPHNFNRLNPESLMYIKHWADEGEKRAVPVYVFCFTDFSHDIDFDTRVKVFLMSSYKSTKKPQEIVIPTTARLFENEKRSPREKGNKPLVSFCGFAGFKTKRQWATYVLKNALWDIKALLKPVLKAHKLGIYWRQVAMRSLELSPLVDTHFIIRRSFSGTHKTIELSPAQARREFIDSIVESDFVLAPKGDGNYSNRFLETLSLGRIPILIDTDSVLPREDEIDYDDIVVRVPMKEVHRTADYVRAFYDACTPEEWKRRQELATHTFQTYLQQDVFFKDYFSAMPIHEPHA